MEAALELLGAARGQQPAERELPRDEEAADAAASALHALLVLLTGALVWALPQCWPAGAARSCYFQATKHRPPLLPPPMLAQTRGATGGGCRAGRLSWRRPFRTGGWAGRRGSWRWACCRTWRRR